MKGTSSQQTFSFAQSVTKTEEPSEMMIEEERKGDDLIMNFDDHEGDMLEDDGYGQYDNQYGGDQQHSQ